MKAWLVLFLKGFAYAWAGIQYGVKTQRNMKVHVVCSLLAVSISLYLGMSPVEWAVLFLTLSGVMTCEMVNTALETTLDRISLEQHPLIRIAKDVSAGAVLIQAVFAVLIGLCLWLPKLIFLFQPQT